ncbi:unnamed protein product [Rotaria magnacalcarata]|uniref:CAP-Gly domain-containing protein n=1 Tax=Rotaria magnacalcarata TaxID=392030 RepID=A0A818XUU6_9BILA|nr:unnamed protein product [Rotaria magnacalcarata]CAF3744578.1 unnamed protein product [Rotaria magnacalcarata]
MPTKIEGRSSSHDLIDDIVEAPSSSSFMSNSISSTMMDTSKILPARHYSSYSNLPSLFNNKSKLEQTDGSSTLLTNELRDRLHLTLPRSSSSSTMVSNDERRKELDLVLKHLYDGKLLTSMHDDRPSSDISEATIPMLTKGPITKTTTTIIKSDDESKHNVGSIEMLSLDDDCTSLQRELQEKELDIMHLSKEIQELQLENKLLKAKVPVLYQNGHTTNNSETEALRREKDVLQNELRAQQELVAKIQQQQHQNGVVARSNKFDEASIYQREALEKKLKAYEKQIHKINKRVAILLSLIDPSFASNAFFSRGKKCDQVTEAKKRNDELLYQEFNSLRNDLKMLKLQNNELFEENHRLQKDQQRQQQNLAWRATLQQAFSTEPLPAPSQQPQQQQQLQQQQQQQILPIENVPTSSPLKLSTTDQRRERSKITMRSESPNLSEGSDSTNYLTTVSVERYNNRPITSIHRSATIDGNNHHRTTRYDPMVGQEEYHRNSFSSATSKSMDPQLNYRSSKTKRSVEWDEENIQQNEGLQHRNMVSYDNQNRLQRQHPMDGPNDYISQPPPPVQSSSSSSPLYQQNYGSSRNVTLPDSQQNTRRSNSYNMPQRQMHNESDIQNDDRHQGRHRRPSVETTSPRRPYAPSSISDIRLNDIVKFSRPGGKISKGVVKYIGTLPGKNDQYLGLELEDEESKHDGIYQGQRLFQCKANKGVFVGFSKVIMAWSGK